MSSDSKSAAGVRWEQATLFEPNSVEIRIQVGVVLDGDHVQAQVEARAAGDDTLLALCSVPHRSLADTAEVARFVAVELDRLLDRFVPPFP